MAEYALLLGICHRVEAFETIFLGPYIHFQLPFYGLEEFTSYIRIYTHI